MKPLLDLIAGLIYFLFGVLVSIINIASAFVLALFSAFGCGLILAVCIACFLCFSFFIFAFL